MQNEPILAFFLSRWLIYEKQQAILQQKCFAAQYTNKLFFFCNKFKVAHFRVLWRTCKKQTQQHVHH